MSKIFLYIDESKDFQSHQIYLGGIVSALGRHSLEQYIMKSLPQKIAKELKSTQPLDRILFEEITNASGNIYGCYSGVYYATSDKDYFHCLKLHICSFIGGYSGQISELEVYLDFNRLSPDMKKTERTFARHLESLLGIPVMLSFRNSKNSLSIQFADIAVGIYRRQHKKS